MSAITEGRQWLMNLLGPQALAELDLERCQPSPELLTLLGEAFAGGTPISDLVLSGIAADEVDPEVLGRLRELTGGTR